MAQQKHIISSLTQLMPIHGDQNGSLKENIILEHPKLGTLVLDILEKINLEELNFMNYYKT